MSHGVHTVAPDFWTRLNSHAGVLTFVVAIITLSVAVITVVVAERPRRSQWRSEKLQEQTKEIQDRMDARDLEFRKSRARASLGHLLQIIGSAANRASETPAYDNLISLLQGWSDDLGQLPKCELKNICNDKLSGLRAPGQNSTVGGDHMERIAYELNQLKTKLADRQLEVCCLEAIKNML